METRGSVIRWQAFQRYHAEVTQTSRLEGGPEPVPDIPPAPRLTRTERATWVVYGLVALLLLALPLITHSFSLPDLAAWILLVGAVAMSAAWLRSGAFQAPEWLMPDDYEQFLRELQREGETPAD